MKTISKTDKPHRLIVGHDFASVFLEELKRQGIDVIEVRNTRSLAKDEHIDMKGVYTVMDVNYGRYDKPLGGPVMVTAKGDYDDMLTAARQIAKGLEPISCTGPIPDSIMTEVNEILASEGKGADPR